MSSLRRRRTFAVELGVHCLTFRGKFMVHIPSNVEKHNGELASKIFDTLAYLKIHYAGQVNSPAIYRDTICTSTTIGKPLL
jgi:hypothetical protein